MDNSLVADHYNVRPKETRSSRKSSPIFQMRLFNNWLKSVLIYLHSRPGFSVLDLCCGKGGDLHKWGEAGATSYVACDTAHVSVTIAADRFNQLSTASFFPLLLVGDCFAVRLQDFLPAERFFDIVSCQFAIHYAFESEQRVRRLLQNVTDRLKPGRFFIGTTVDANVLIRKIRAINDLTISSDVYQVKFDEHFKSKRFTKGSPYGIRYTFTLDQSVEDCPEYLVHFPSFVTLAEEYDLELVMYLNFHDFFTEFSSEQYPAYRDLLFSMRVLNDEGSITPDQWDAIYLYTAFAFQKRGATSEEKAPVEVKRREWPNIPHKDIIIMNSDGK